MTCSSLIILSEKEKNWIQLNLNLFQYLSLQNLYNLVCDNKKSNKTAEKVNNFIKLVKLKFIDNGAITDKHLGRSGLHLNRNENIIFAKYLSNAIRS